MDVFQHFKILVRMLLPKLFRETLYCCPSYLSRVIKYNSLICDNFSKLQFSSFASNKGMNFFVFLSPCINHFITTFPSNILLLFSNISSTQPQFFFNSTLFSGVGSISRLTSFTLTISCKVAC